MVKHHPDSNYLIDYAAGCLPRAQALCVAAHLHYCPGCKCRVRELNDVGSALFLNQPPTEVKETVFSRVMERIEGSNGSNGGTGEDIALQAQPLNDTSDDQSSDSQTTTASPDLPGAIHKITRGDFDNIKWHTFIGNSFRFSKINSGDNGRITSLLYLKAGGKVPSHSHDGDEITVVLKGSFFDQEGYYRQGDFIVRSNGQAHSPVATQEEDCVCLAAYDGPIIMTHWFHRLLQPLFNRRIS